MTQTVLLYFAVGAGTTMQKGIFAELNCHVLTVFNKKLCPSLLFIVKKKHHVSRVVPHVGIYSCNGVVKLRMKFVQLRLSRVTHIIVYYMVYEAQRTIDFYLGKMTFNMKFNQMWNCFAQSSYFNHFWRTKCVHWPDTHNIDRRVFFKYMYTVTSEIRIVRTECGSVFRLTFQSPLTNNYCSVSLACVIICISAECLGDCNDNVQWSVMLPQDPTHNCSML